jgi:hypothetical protein
VSIRHGREKNSIYRCKGSSLFTSFKNNVMNSCREEIKTTASRLTALAFFYLFLGTTRRILGCCDWILSESACMVPIIIYTSGTARAIARKCGHKFEDTEMYTRRYIVCIIWSNIQRKTWFAKPRSTVGISKHNSWSSFDSQHNNDL